MKKLRIFFLVLFVLAILISVSFVQFPFKTAFSPKLTQGVEPNDIIYLATKNTRETTLEESSNSLSGWSYRMPIDFYSLNSLTDYQVSVDLNTQSLIAAGKMKNNCEDIRFTDSNGTALLNYWLESDCNRASTKLWVKIPSLAARQIKTIYVYYGNSSAASASNGDATFIFFDGFGGSSIDGGKWAINNATGWSVVNGELKGTNTTGRLRSVSTFSAPITQEVRTRTVTVAPNGQTTGGFWNSTSDGFTLLQYANPDYVADNATWVSLGGNFIPESNTSLLIRLDAISGTAVRLTSIRLDTGATTYVSLYANAVSNETIMIGQRADNLYQGQAYETYWDWIRVRKYSSAEPQQQKFCARGFAEESRFQGRFLVGTPNNGAIGGQRGLPLTDLEDRLHTHYLYWGLWYSNSVGRPYFFGYINNASSNLPYIQIAGCKKISANADLPVGAIYLSDNTYSASQSCAPGFTENSDLKGRFLAGVPYGGSLGGKSPYASLANLGKPLHQHYIGYNGSNTTGSQQLAQQTWTSYDYVGFPYIQLLGCEKTLLSAQVPTGAMFLYLATGNNDSSVLCPSDYKKVTGDIEGRYLVGLPSGGAIGAVLPNFNPLTNLEDRKHTHTAVANDTNTDDDGGDYTGSINIDSYGASPKSTRLPYVQVLACRKNNASQIAVTAPNGGENWVIGDSQAITWTYNNINPAGNVKIELSRDGGATYSTIAISTSNDGTESWTVTSPPTFQGRIKITSLTASAFDTSNNNFNIQSRLIVAKKGSGGGTVSSNPPGINCGADCSESYTSGISVGLTAAPATGSIFASWSGDCSGTTPACGITMNANKAVTAIFNTSLKQCSDTLDNDNDGKIDLDDSGCSSPNDNDERTPKFQEI